MRKVTEELTTAINNLLDAIIEEQNLKNDAALARFLETTPPVVSKMRHGRVGISGDMKIRLHEKTGKPISEIQAAVAVAT